MAVAVAVGVAWAVAVAVILAVAVAVAAAVPCVIKNNMVKQLLFATRIPGHMQPIGRPCGTWMHYAMSKRKQQRSACMLRVVTMVDVTRLVWINSARTMRVVAVVLVARLARCAWWMRLSSHDARAAGGAAGASQSFIYYCRTPDIRF